jgi:large subunit ribosomal protein L29
VLVREIRSLGTPDIQKKLEDAREEYFNLRFQRASGQLEDYNQIRKARRNISRLLTVLREREIAEWIGDQEGEAREGTA